MFVALNAHELHRVPFGGWSARPAGCTRGRWSQDNTGTEGRLSTQSDPNGVTSTLSRDHDRHRPGRVRLARRQTTRQHRHRPAPHGRPALTPSPGSSPASTPSRAGTTPPTPTPPTPSTASTSTAAVAGATRPATGSPTTRWTSPSPLPLSPSQRQRVRSGRTVPIASCEPQRLLKEWREASGQRVPHPGWPAHMDRRGLTGDERRWANER
jgi:hypothetical protein